MPPSPRGNLWCPFWYGVVLVPQFLRYHFVRNGNNCFGTRIPTRTSPDIPGQRERDVCHLPKQCCNTIRMAPLRSGCLTVTTFQGECTIRRKACMSVQTRFPTSKFWKVIGLFYVVLALLPPCCTPWTRTRNFGVFRLGRPLVFGHVSRQNRFVPHPCHTPEYVGVRSVV